MNPKHVYKINDLVKALDRDKTTILRWEKEGNIPQAKRDSRGWRYYTEDEFQGILKKVKETRYFNRRVMALVVSLILVVNAISFLVVSQIAWTNSNLNANLNIAAGTLAVTASTSVQTFQGVTYSFSNQSSSATHIGDASVVKAESVKVSDTRGGAGSWTLNLSCIDGPGECKWRGGTENDRFQQASDLSTTANASSSGILCIDCTTLGCLNTGGPAGCGSIALCTAFTCFAASKADITLGTGTGANGEYYLKEAAWQQGIPDATSASVYTTTLVYDLS